MHRHFLLLANLIVAECGTIYLVQCRCYWYSVPWENGWTHSLTDVTVLSALSSMVALRMASASPGKRAETDISAT